MSLFEIQEGGQGGVEQDEPADAQQVAARQHTFYAVEHPAAQGLFLGLARMRFRVHLPVAQSGDGRQRQGQHSCSDGQEVDRAEYRRKGPGGCRSGNGAGGAACGNKAEKALRLALAENICHEAPEYGDDEQVEDAGPDEEGPGNGDFRPLQFECCKKQQHVDNKKAVDHRHEGSPGIARGQPGVYGHRRCHGDEGAGE